MLKLLSSHVDWAQRSLKQLLQIKINIIIVHLNTAFLKLYVESLHLWIGKHETVGRLQSGNQLPSYDTMVLYT
jgi:hypothetical protein